MNRKFTLRLISIRSVVALFLVSISPALIAPLILSVQASALTQQGNGEWIDQTHIYYVQGNEIFTEYSTSTGAGGSATMILRAPGVCANKGLFDQMTIGGQYGVDYHTSPEADITNEFDSSCSGEGQSIFLKMNNNYNQIGSPNNGLDGQAEWLSATQMEDLGTGYTYSMSNITGGVMTLTGDTSASGTCNGPGQMTIGDPNGNSYLSAQTATVIVPVISGTGHGTCNNQSKQLTIVNKSIDVTPTAHWSQSDPKFGEITIDTVPAQYLDQQGNPTPQAQAEGMVVGDTWSENNATINGGVNGNDMTLYFPDTPNCKGANSYNPMDVNPYQSADYATITYFTLTPGHETSNCTASTVIVDLTTTYNGTPTTGNPGGSNPANGDGCVLPDGNGLRWLACPIFSLLQEATSAMNDLLINLMIFPVSQYFTPGMETVFNIFRNIAVGMLIIAGLAMVVSQAADLEIFAAHTVRKALPRIVIAAILISLAWPLLQFVIGFFNDFGQWIGQIILGAAAASGGDQINNNLGQAISGITDGIITGLGIAAAFVVLGVAGVLSLFVSLILVLLLSVFVLMVRQIIILACILLAPIAIAAQVTPGTEKIGRFITDTGITALAMFPIVMICISSADAMAEITVNVHSGSYFYHILAAGFMIAGIVMVPFSIKLAGGLMSRIVDFAQNTHSKTIGGQLQAFRQKQAAWNMKRVGAGSRYNPDNRWTRRLVVGNVANRLGARVKATAQGHLPWGAGNAAARANNSWMDADTAAKLDSNFMAQRNNEEAMVAIAFGNDESKLRQLAYFRDATVEANGQTKGENRLRSALVAGRTMKPTQQLQRAGADALARSGKIINDRKELNYLLDSVSHGNAALRAAEKGMYQYTYRQVGRADLGRDTDLDALKELDIATLNQQKPQSLENLFGSINPSGGNPGIIEAINRSTDSRERQHFADVLYAAQYASSLSPEKQKAVLNGIEEINRRGLTGIDKSNNVRPLMHIALENYRDKLTNPSDRRVKRHIAYLCTLRQGIKLYRFEYIWGGPAYVGVMAQDILGTHPGAVSIDSDGYYRVNYGMLGLRMVEYVQWIMPLDGVVDPHINKVTK